mmetsp:Transcript_18170/g.26233  ORF Transcript_18170/g.26233 Transcript_18170/m.26233 type:complete len:312 (-) Transcript_18170:1750-2685(-)
MMEELIVKDINSEWSISLPISNGLHMNLGALKKQIFEANNEFAVDRQNFIYMGVILNEDSVELRNLLSGDGKVCLHMFLSKSNTAILKENVCGISNDASNKISVDETSISAADKWLGQNVKTLNDGSPHYEYLSTILNELKEAASKSRLVTVPSVTPGGPVAAPPAPVAAEAIENRPEARINWFDFALMFRLVFTVAMISYYNKQTELSSETILYISMSMVVLYLILIGAVWKWIVWLEVHVSMLLQGNHRQPAPPNQIHNNNGTLSLLYGAIRQGMAIPAEPGILLDFFALVSSMLCSLYPDWKPVVHRT